MGEIVGRQIDKNCLTPNEKEEAKTSVTSGTERQICLPNLLDIMNLV